MKKRKICSFYFVFEIDHHHSRNHSVVDDVFADPFYSNEVFFLPNFVCRFCYWPIEYFRTDVDKEHEHKTKSGFLLSIFYSLEKKRKRKREAVNDNRIKQNKNAINIKKHTSVQFVDFVFQMDNSTKTLFS